MDRSGAPEKRKAAFSAREQAQPRGKRPARPGTQHHLRDAGRDRGRRARPRRPDRPTGLAAPAARPHRGSLERARGGRGSEDRPGAPRPDRWRRASPRHQGRGGRRSASRRGSRRARQVQCLRRSPAGSGPATVADGRQPAPGARPDGQAARGARAERDSGRSAGHRADQHAGHPIRAGPALGNRHGGIDVDPAGGPERIRQRGQPLRQVREPRPFRRALGFALGRPIRHAGRWVPAQIADSDRSSRPGRRTDRRTRRQSGATLRRIPAWPRSRPWLRLWESRLRPRSLDSAAPSAGGPRRHLDSPTWPRRCERCT